MSSNLLQSLQVLTEFALHSVCQHLCIFAIDDVALSVEEPGWDLVLGRVLDDGNNALEFFGSNFTGTSARQGEFLMVTTSHVPLVQVDIGFLADQVGISSAHTLDLSQGVHDLLFAIDVGVEETENELDFLVR